MAKCQVAVTCQRCGVDGELGRCPFCRRQLCVTCYDLDQDGNCRLSHLAQRNEAIRALHGSMPVKEIAVHFKMSPRQTWRVLSG